MTEYRRKSNAITVFRLPEWVRKIMKDKNISITAFVEGAYLVVEGEVPNERTRLVDPSEFEREFEPLPEVTPCITNVRYMPDGPDPNKPRSRV